MQKKRKLVICGEFKLPHSSATANYIENIARMMSRENYDVFVCTTVVSSFLPNTEEEFTIIPLNSISSGIKRAIDLVTKLIPELLSKLESINMSSNDILMSYSLSPTFTSTILMYAKKYRIQTMTSVVEWYDHSVFAGGFLSPFYWANAFVYYSLNTKFDLILTISKNIKKYYDTKGNKTLLLPPVIESSEKYCTDKPEDGIIRFIFPGRPGIKGDFGLILQALNYLNDDELRRIEVHFTGISSEELSGALDCGNNEIFKECFIAHGWLDYEELICLYRRMNCLFLIREIKRATISNFPSKGPEALKYGVFPLATRTGDFEKDYIIDGVNGIIVDFSAESIAEGIRRVLALESLKNMSSRAFETSHEFNISKWGNKVDKFIGI